MMGAVAWLYARMVQLHSSPQMHANPRAIKIEGYRKSVSDRPE